MKDARLEGTQVATPSRQVLYEDQFVTLSLDEAGGVVRYQRSTMAFGTAEEIATTHDEVHSAVQTLNRARFGLLVDLRNAQRGGSRSLRSTAQTTLVEQAMARERPRLLRGYRRLAFVVATPVGKMQLQRHLDDAGLDALVTLDEDEALHSL